MRNIMFYVARPYMPLPPEMTGAVGLGEPTTRTNWTWSQLTDGERDKLLELFPPTVAVAVLQTAHFEFVATGAAEQAARTALECAWAVHAGELDADPDYPVAQDTNVITGPLGTVFRDGSPYPRS
jgi:hypothetical protein